MENYIVLDLEWNQGYKETEVPELPFEIIEIGAVRLDKDKNVTGEFSCLIKPQVYRTMHYMTSKIVNITMNDLINEQEFQNVMDKFLTWCGKDYIFCTWGTLDLVELQRNIKYFGMEPLADGPLMYLDIQKIFSISEEDGKSRRTLEYAVDYKNIEKNDSFHRALSDAYYTAMIFQNISDRNVEKRVSFDVYHIPSDKSREIHITFDDYSKYISRAFNDKSEAFADREVMSTRCFVCNKNAKRRVNWFTVNGKHYFSLIECREHGYMRAKLRIKKADDGGIYVIKTIKKIDQKAAAEVYSKAKKARFHQNAISYIKNQNGQIPNGSGDSAV